MSPTSDRSLPALTDEQILSKWMVWQLDAMHKAIGLGEEWMESDRREELVQLEGKMQERRFLAQNTKNWINPKTDVCPHIPLHTMLDLQVCREDSELVYVNRDEIPELAKRTGLYTEHHLYQEYDRKIAGGATSVFLIVSKSPLPRHA